MEKKKLQLRGNMIIENRFVVELVEGRSEDYKFEGHIED